MSGDPLHQKESDVIVCHVTTWYYRRMGLLAAMFLGMGLFFFYDGKYGYPKENAVAEKKVWFEETVLKGYDEARAQGDTALQAWLAMARERGWIVKPGLDQPRWDDYGAPHDWPSSPKKHSAEEIEQQFYWGGAMLLGAATAGLLVLLNHAKTLVGHHDHLVMPNGRKVYYKDVFRVDKRKWDNKALATVAYREGGTGPESKVVLDDLKYLGTDKVLNRLLAGFKGELIEKIPDEPEAELEAVGGPAKAEEESAPKNAT